VSLFDLSEGLKLVKINPEERHHRGDREDREDDDR